jgi:hypothetical protein
VLNGGQRPPFALVMASMRQLAIGVLALILCAQIAHGADRHCQLLNADHIEWSEGDEFRGAHIVGRDPRWELGEVDWNMASTVSASCRTCSDHQLSGGPLWLWVSERLQSDIYKWISPESVARAMQLRSHSREAEFHAVSYAVQVSVGGYPGFARAFYPSMTAVAQAKSSPSQSPSQRNVCHWLAFSLKRTEHRPQLIGWTRLRARLQSSRTSPSQGNLLRYGEGRRQSFLLAI